MMNVNDLIANWTAPNNILALTTTKLTGFSHGAYANNNFGLHVGDDASNVHANRHELKQRLSLPGEPIWLNQTHSTDCVIVKDAAVSINADAAVTSNQSFPLAIMTADCLPIVLTNNSGTEIAAIHAGWRGLLNGIIENTLNKMQSMRESLIAWIGPAICGNCYATGSDVVLAFKSKHDFASLAINHKNSQFYLSLSKMAELILISQGVSQVFQSNACTFEDENTWYSYRKAAQTGRMATLIWFRGK